MNFVKQENQKNQATNQDERELIEQIKSSWNLCSPLPKSSERAERLKKYIDQGYLVFGFNIKLVKNENNEWKKDPLIQVNYKLPRFNFKICQDYKFQHLYQREFSYQYPKDIDPNDVKYDMNEICPYKAYAILTHKHKTEDQMLFLIDWDMFKNNKENKVTNQLYDWIIETYGLPKTWIQRTGTGGYHWIFKIPKNKNIKQLN